MVGRMASPKGKEGQARQNWMAKALHGWINETMGFRHFCVKGLGNVRGERNPLCLMPDAGQIAVALAG